MNLKLHINTVTYVRTFQHDMVGTSLELERIVQVYSCQSCEDVHS